MARDEDLYRRIMREGISSIAAIATLAGKGNTRERPFAFSISPSSVDIIALIA